MATKSWKELEKTVAAVLGGSRLTKTSYADSQPDVVVDKINNSILGADVFDRDISLIVECKYSQDQPWQRIASDLMTKFQTASKVAVVSCHDLLLWDLHDTSMLLTYLHGEPSTSGCPLLRVVDKFSIIPMDKKVPKYIRQVLGQAGSYGDWAKSKLWIPAACLGQKGAHRRVMLAQTRDLWGIKHDGTAPTTKPGDR